LYDFDVGLRVVKFHFTKPHAAFTAGSELKDIVFLSTCRVEEGSTTDWKTVASYLKGISDATFKRDSVPTFDLGIWREYADPKVLLPRVQKRAGITPDP
jgi:hypothetical protein